MKTWSTHLALAISVSALWCVCCLYFVPLEAILETFSEEANHIGELPGLLHDLSEPSRYAHTAIAHVDFGGNGYDFTGFWSRLTIACSELRIKLQGMFWIGVFRIFSHLAEVQSALLFGAAYLCDGICARRLRRLSFQNTRPGLSYLATHLSVLSLWGIVLSLMTPEKCAIIVAQVLTVLGCLCVSLAIRHNRRHLG